MADIFKFKQFDVNQSGCAMKVNTDGVLLGSLAEASNPESILDIGTGTGVIALMLAQRFEQAVIEAVEIDETAAATASENFKASKFTDRVSAYAMGFEAYFDNYPNKKFDLIVSNPPFFLNSLASPGAKKNLARHTDDALFERLIKSVAAHLTSKGLCAMVLPLETAQLVKELLPLNGLCLQSMIEVKSFVESLQHREILTIGKQQLTVKREEFVIYAAPKVYHEAYHSALKEFLTIF